MHEIYTNGNKNKLIDCYKNFGIKSCIEQFNVKSSTVYNILKKENIKPTNKCHNKTYRNQKYLNVNGDDFINVTTKYHAYILGLLWADGWLRYKGKIKNIRIELTKTDADNIECIFDKTGKWNVYYRKQSKKRKERTGFVASSAKFADFLFDKDYKIKSVASPTKIYDVIPSSLKKYFLLGWIDGDGCFYINEKSSRIEFTMAGSYTQDWKCLENIFHSLNITNYKIKRKVMKNGNKYSIVRILRKGELEKLKTWLYEDGFEFGLKRKYDKLIKITNS